MAGVGHAGQVIDGETRDPLTAQQFAVPAAWSAWHGLDTPAVGPGESARRRRPSLGSHSRPRDQPAVIWVASAEARPQAFRLGEAPANRIARA